MADIAHVVVLMLENRSFDSMLGTLYPAGPGFDGLTGTETNPSPVGPIQVWNCGTLTDAAACIPTPDPGDSAMPDGNTRDRPRSSLHS